LPANLTFEKPKYGLVPRHSQSLYERLLRRSHVAPRIHGTKYLTKHP